MAALTTSQVNAIYVQGDSALTGLYGLRGVNAGDTLDLSVVSAPPFHAVKRAVLLGISVTAAEAPAIAGTVITIPAGAVEDSAYLLAWGS